uniref:SMP-30/gluconolactonase/LRE family protein n=1 Tax=Pararhizobium sp. IMCC3301 TaxID=3067904 RepID=UPI0027429002|nr:SMP-30/gluconolactonase/LRE family protein [Pararhizobium sp. IMCC3301]
MPTHEIPRLELDDARFVGQGLARPECVLAFSGNRLLVSDWRGGVTLIRGNGSQKTIIARGEVPPGGLRPNGIAVNRRGEILLAHLDDQVGGVWLMNPDGLARPWLLEVDSVPLPPTNFVYCDDRDRTWITVSTRHIPRTVARSKHIADGYIVVVVDGHAKIVADGIGFTNEAKVDPSGQWLYVNETFGRRLIRFPIDSRAELGRAEIVAEFGPGVFPDGLEFDADGNIWITSVFSNRLLRVDRRGHVETLLDDSVHEFVDVIEQQFSSDSLKDRPPEKIPSRVLRNISSAAFGGSKRQRIFLGCLQGDSISYWDVDTVGAQPPYWDWLNII